MAQRTAQKNTLLSAVAVGIITTGVVGGADWWISNIRHIENFNIVSRDVIELKRDHKKVREFQLKGGRFTKEDAEKMIAEIAERLNKLEARVTEIRIEMAGKK